MEVISERTEGIRIRFPNFKLLKLGKMERNVS